MKKIVSVLLAFCLILSGMLLFSACGEEENVDPVKVVMTVKDYGKITLELYPKYAPITVENFLKLVDEEFYDGLTFHRVMKDFMIQGGDPKGDGTGGSDETIKGEFSENGIDNPLGHKRGAISMARGSYSMDSASSQFFICHADCSNSLDGKYASFGKVIEGMDVVDAIAEVEVSYNSWGEPSVPNETIIIESIRRVEENK